MNRRRACLAVLGLLVALLAGCADDRSVRAPAATVNATVIAAADLEDELRVLADSEPLREALDANGGPRIWTTDGAVSSDIASQWLASMVQDAVIAQDLEERGVEPSEEQRAAAAELAAAQLGGPAVFDTFPEWFRERLVDRTARAETLLAEVTGGPPTEARLRAYYEERRAELCPSGVRLLHLLVPTEAAASAARAEIVGGTPFATVAARVSTDEPSAVRGGDLGCRGVEQYVTEFQSVADSLVPGQLSAPVQTQFGWHLITVTEDSFEGARADVEAAYDEAARERFGEYLRDELLSSDVVVDPRFGRVFESDDIFEVLPPEPPSVREVPGPRLSGPGTEPEGGDGAGGGAGTQPAP